MAFTVDDFSDLLRLLEQRPEWRADLRRLVLTEELLDLPAAVQRLTERLDRLTERVERLAEQQERFAEQLGRLAEQQATLSERVEALVAAQLRTEQRLVELGIAQHRTQAELSSLANVLGARVEVDADGALWLAAKAHGWTPLQDVGRPLQLNDGEVDVALQVRDESGNQLWLLVEAKVRLRRGDVHDWANTLQSRQFRERLRQHGVDSPIVAYGFGIRVYADAEDAAIQHGIGILHEAGERVAPTKRW